MNLPKPYVIYVYKTSNGWIGIVWEEKEGWNWSIKDRQNKLRRMAYRWPTKTIVLDMMLESLEELSDTKDIKFFDSVYRYPTVPEIEIRKIGSKWNWKYGKRFGSEKSKKLALEKASQFWRKNEI